MYAIIENGIGEFRFAIDGIIEIANHMVTIEIHLMLHDFDAHALCLRREGSNARHFLAGLLNLLQRLQRIHQRYLAAFRLRQLCCLHLCQHLHVARRGFHIRAVDLETGDGLAGEIGKNGGGPLNALGCHLACLVLTELNCSNIVIDHSSALCGLAP